MVERRLITKELVDFLYSNASEPLWISDTRIKGFGLRVWRAPSGRCKVAYVIRARDSAGSHRRRTFDPNGALSARRYTWNYFSKNFDNWQEPEPTLGSVVTEARRWAYDMIQELNDRPTLDQEEATQRAIVTNRVSGYTFARALEVIIQGMRKRGLSEGYCDQLDRLQALFIPDQVLQKLLHEINEDDLFLALSSRELSEANLRTLRPLVRKAIQLAEFYGRRPTVSSYSFRALSNRISDARYGNTARAENSERIVGIVDLLHSQHTTWQQAYCMYLYLSSRCPLSRLMCARWDQLFIRNHEANEWFGPDEQHGRFVFVYGDRARDEIQLTKLQFDLLRRAREHHQKKYDNSPFIFPSPTKPASAISSVRSFWVRFLEQQNFPYRSPREFKLAYRFTQNDSPWWLDEIATTDPILSRDTLGN